VRAIRVCVDGHPGQCDSLHRGEEEKMEAETLKLLGKLEGNAVKASGRAHERQLQPRGGGGRTHGEPLGEAAQAGHARGDSGSMGGVSSAGRTRPAHGPRAAGALRAAGRPAATAAGSQPRQRDGSDVGRLRPCSVLDWKFTVLSHNTVRGAAGATILNAELLASLGKLEPVAEAATRA